MPTSMEMVVSERNRMYVSKTGRGLGNIEGGALEAGRLYLWRECVFFMIETPLQTYI